MPEFLGIPYKLPVEILNREDTQEVVTQSLAIYRPSSGSQRWELKIGIGPFKYTDEEVVKIGVHQNKVGLRQSFTLEMPQYIDADLTTSATITLKAVANVKTKTITLQATAEVIIPQGRFIKFPGHNKIYQVVDEVTVPAGSAGASVTIYPGIIKREPAAGEIDITPDIKVFYIFTAPTSILHRATGRVEKIINLIEDVKI